LVTAPEIMFFWVARMIVAGYEYVGKPPFKNVYYTGIVRDKLGRKMSKQLGNSPDAIQLMEKYSADGVRVGMLLSSPAGNDLLFDSALCEQGRNFTNKIWNALRLVKGWEITESVEQPEVSVVAAKWFSAQFNNRLVEINNYYDKFRISDALMSTYKLVWDDFCSWYLEMIKPGYEQPIDKATYDQVLEFFDLILKLIHPFTPFLAEEAWHLLKNRTEDIIVSPWPDTVEFDQSVVDSFENTMDIVSGIRTIRKDNNIAFKVVIEMHVIENNKIDRMFDPVLVKLGNIEQLIYSNDKPQNAFSFVVKNNEYFVPFNDNV